MTGDEGLRGPGAAAVGTGGAGRSGLGGVGVVRDRPVVDTRTLQRLVASTSAGEILPLTVLRRDDGRHPVTVRVGVMPDTVAADRIAAEFGFLVRDPDTQGEES